MTRAPKVDHSSWQAAEARGWYALAAAGGAPGGAPAGAPGEGSGGTGGAGSTVVICLRRDAYRAACEAHPGAAVYFPPEVEMLNRRTARAELRESIRRKVGACGALPAGEARSELVTAVSSAKRLLGAAWIVADDPRKPRGPGVEAGGFVAALCEAEEFAATARRYREKMASEAAARAAVRVAAGEKRREKQRMEVADE